MRQLDQKGFGISQTLIVLVGIVLLVFAGWYVYKAQGSRAGIIDMPGEPTFYYTTIDLEDNTAKQTLHFIQPASSKKSETIIEPPSRIKVSSLEQNNSVQLSLDGRTIAYATEVFDDGTNNQNDSDVFNLYVEQKNEQPLHALKDKKPGTVVDWKLSSDGKTIYYIEQATSGKEVSNPAQFFSYDVTSKTSKKLGTVTIEKEANVSKLYESQDGTSIHFFKIVENGLFETTYRENTKILGTNKVLNLSECACSISRDGLSPDATKLLLNDSGREIYLVDLLNKNTKSVAPKQDGLAYGNESWLADSSRFTISTYPFGKNTPTKPYKVLEVVAESGKSKTIFGQTTSGSALITWGWSANGRYLTYNDGYDLKFYDKLKNRHIDGTPDLFDGLYTFDSEHSYGWIQQ